MTSDVGAFDDYYQMNFSILKNVIHRNEYSGEYQKLIQYLIGLPILKMSSIFRLLESIK